MEKQLWSKSEARQWTIILFGGTLTLYAARVSMPICVVQISHEYSWTKTESGAVLACFFWGYTCTQVFGGWLADRIGGERCLAFASLFWGLLTFLMPAAFYLFYAALGAPIVALTIMRVIMGAFQGIHYPAMSSLVAQKLVSNDKSRVFGIVSAGSHAGTVICGSLGSYLLEYYGWRFVFYFIGLLSLCWCALLYMLNKPRGTFQFTYKEHTILSHIKPKPNDMSKINIEKNPPMTKRARPVPWGRLLRHSSFWAAFVAHYCGANAFYTLFSWLPSYFAESFPTDAKGWVFNVVPYASVATTSLLAPFIAARMLARGQSVTRVRRIMESGSLIGIGMCLFAVARVQSYEVAMTLLTLAMAARGFHHAGVAVNAQDMAPDHAGVVFGLMNMASAIPGFIGVYIAGYILEKYHSWPHVFAATGMQCLFGAIIYAVLGTGQQLI